MIVLVNGVTLNVTNAYPERNDATGVITLTVIVPQAEMEYAELKALFKENTEDITKTADDGSTELFSGFSYVKTVDDDANDTYIVKLTANEHDFQLGRNRQLEADKANLESTVAVKESEIIALNGTITERNVTIEGQTATIEELEQVIVSKDEEIAELLTIAEEYADLLYAEALEEIEADELKEIDPDELVDIETVVESEVPEDESI